MIKRTTHTNCEHIPSILYAESVKTPQYLPQTAPKTEVYTTERPPSD